MSLLKRIGSEPGMRLRSSWAARLRSCATMPVFHPGFVVSLAWLSTNYKQHLQVGMDLNLSVMAIGATTGITYAVERMSRSKGGKGGRIITTASVAGLVVSTVLIGYYGYLGTNYSVVSRQ